MLCRSFDPELLKGARTQTRRGDEPVTSFVYQRYNVAIPARCYLCVRVEQTMNNQGQKYWSSNPKFLADWRLNMTSEEASSNTKKNPFRLICRL